MEGGNLSEWYLNGGGGEYNGNCSNPCSSTNGSTSEASQEQARSGNWSAKLTIPGTGAVRLYRWKEPHENREAYYSAWYFVPQRYTVNLYGWANWFQFKSATTDGKHDPFFILDWRNAQATGQMYFLLTWWPGLKIEGPQPGQSGGRTWPSPVEIPVGRWFHVEVRYVCAGDFTGAIQVWQDDVEIFKLENIRTRYDNGDCQWSINNYAENISPSPVSIYIDDAVISETRVGP